MRFADNIEFSNVLAIEVLSYSRSRSATKKELVLRLLPPILYTAASRFELARYSSKNKEQSSRFDYPYSSWTECEIDWRHDQRNKGRLDAYVVADFYQQILQLYPEQIPELLTKIQEQTEQLLLEELSRLVVPLLEEMLHIVNVSSPEISRFYQSMMGTFITRFVQKEPRKPKDWSRPSKFECYRSDCTECPTLREFLIQPEEKSRKFTLNKDRYHLFSHVPDDCTKHESNPPEPPVLTVTKTLKGWEREHKDWSERASEAQTVFKQWPSEELKQCLGEQYDAIMNLRAVKLDPYEVSPEASASGIFANRTSQKRVRTDEDIEPEPTAPPQKLARTGSGQDVTKE